MVKIDCYETVEELIDGIYRTQFEKDNGITQTEKLILPELSNEDIKVILVKKSTGEYGLVLALKVSKRKGGWQKVYPYEEVVMKFPNIYKKYLEIDKHNKIAKEKWKKENETNTN